MVFISYSIDICCTSVKSKLHNGEILIAGDQWPIFVYMGYKFNPEEPWGGLLRSSILVSVSAFTASVTLAHPLHRPISLSSHLLAQLIRM